MMKTNKQNFYSNLSIFLHIMLVLVIFSFFFSISKSFPFILTIPIAFLSIVFFVTLKKKKGTENESLFQEKLPPLFDVSEIEFNQQSESRNFLVKDETFEFNVHEQMQHDDLQSDSSLPSDSESFEIDYNEYQKVSSCDGLDSNTDDGDDDYDYENDNDDERFNRIIIYTNYNIDGKEESLLSYTPSVYPVSDEYEEEEGDDEEDSLIEINLLNRNFSNFADESTQKMESELLDFLSESIFKQQNFMHLLSEINDMNEDENLIEIDISM